MSAERPFQNERKAVCGQAQAVLDNLEADCRLPHDLSLSIEEILEDAWEIAYRTEIPPRCGNVIVFKPLRGRR